MINKSSIISSKFLSLFLLTLAVLPFISSVDALAQTGTQVAGTADVNKNILANTMCNVMAVVTGNAGKAFAAFAVISVGIGFFTGKVSWSLMIGVAAGIAAMFGAPSIVAAITGKEAFGCSG